MEVSWFGQLSSSDWELYQEHQTNIILLSESWGSLLFVSVKWGLWAAGWGKMRTADFEVYDVDADHKQD